jgi:CubicO group peptidase (beta-lactamase class C family)
MSLTPARWRQSSHRPADRLPNETWDRAPYNRWSFQHIRELVPTVEVWRGEAPASILERAPREIGRIAVTRHDGSKSTVAGVLEATFTDGFIVVKSNRVVTEIYMNGMTERTLHLSQSVAKSVTASVAGVLIWRGVLDPQAPVTEYLPELAKTAYSGAKLQHLLDMTSGVRFGEEYTDRFSDIGLTDVASGWKAIPADKPPSGAWPESIWDQILTLKTKEAEHGSRFKYRSIETDVLAFCMERASGQRLAELTSEHLWQPMGAEEDACFTVDRSGYALADGGFNATLRDYARVGLVHLGIGTFNGRSILPAEWVADIRRGPHGLANDHVHELFPNGCYRNQFWIEDRAKETTMARGVFGQLIYIAPEHDMVVVKLSSYPEFINVNHSKDTLAAIRAIAAELT